VTVIAKESRLSQKPVKGAMIREQARVWRPSHMDGVELLHARYRGQTFSKHFHESFAVGVIQAGALKFDYRGSSMLAAPGEINLCLAGEAHNGEAANEAGWQYRMLYLGNHWLHGALQGTGGIVQRQKPWTPFFTSGVLKDPELAAEMLHLHCSMEPGKASALEQEGRLLSLLHRLVVRHSHPRPPERRVKSCPRAVSLTRDFLASNLTSNPSLSELGRIAGLSRFHLLRIFSREVGLTPHAFQVQMRLHKARALIRDGMPLADAALTSGFSDQSHLSRRFKKVYGLTPGQYQKSVTNN
jgi:AraC-like DNA-binding protein